MQAMRRVARTTMLLCLLVAMAPTAHAQVDPRGTMRTIAMPHFRVHFRPDQEVLARRAAFLAETAWGVGVGACGVRTESAVLSECVDAELGEGGVGGSL